MKIKVHLNAKIVGAGVTPPIKVLQGVTGVTPATVTLVAVIKRCSTFTAIAFVVF